MSIQHSTRVIFKGVWRDMKTYMRYKAFFTGMLLEIISLVLGFAIIGGAYYFSPDVLTRIGLGEEDLFLFMMTGAIIQMFSSIATWAPLNRIEEDITDQLDATMVTAAKAVSIDFSADCDSLTWATHVYVNYLYDKSLGVYPTIAHTGMYANV